MGNITFTMIKPEAVESRNIGAILNRIENAGFRISAMKKVHLSIDQASKFYQIHLYILQAYIHKLLMNVFHITVKAF